MNSPLEDGRKDRWGPLKGGVQGKEEMASSRGWHLKRATKNHEIPIQLGGGECVC